MTDSSSTRLAWLDSGKALTIILLVYMSVQRALFANGFTDFGHGFHIADSVLNAFVFTACFFFSGAQFEQLRGRDTHLYFLFDKLLYPFILWTVAQVLVEIIFSDYTGGAALLSDIFYELVDRPSTHFWLLPALLVNQLLGHVLLRGAKPSLPALGIIAAVVCLGQNWWPTVYPLNYLADYFIYFVLGVACARHSAYLHTKRWPLGALALLLFIAGNALFHGQWRLETYQATAVTALLALPGIFCLLFLALVFAGARYAALHWLGKASFAIFLMHFIAGSGVREVLANSFALSNTALHLLIGVIAAIALPLLAFAIIQRWRIPGLLRAPAPVNAYHVTKLARAIFAPRPLLRTATFASLALLALALFGLRVGTTIALRKAAEQAPPSTVQFTDAPQAIAEGQRLAQLFGCYRGCHGNNLEGIIFSRAPLVGTFASANLTRAIRQYSPAELDGIIRHGLWPGGAPVVGGMPSAGFRAMDDQQLSAILSFIRAAPKQANTPPPLSLGVKTQWQIINGTFTSEHQLGEQAQQHFATPPTAELARGQQLVRIACSECHGPMLRGKPELRSPPLLVARAYQFEQFTHLLQTGVKLDGQDAGLMGVVARNRFAKFNENELKAIYAFLNTLE